MHVMSEGSSGMREREREMEEKAGQSSNRNHTHTPLKSQLNSTQIEMREEREERKRVLF